MKREELELIGKKDCTGKDIRVGDVFEYENIYIVTKDLEADNFFIREYENQVEYGVEEEPYYILVGTWNIDELDLDKDQIKDNIYLNEELHQQLHEELED